MNNVVETQQAVDSESFQMLTMAMLLQLKMIQCTMMYPAFCFTILRLINPSFPYTLFVGKEE